MNAKNYKTFQLFYPMPDYNSFGFGETYARELPGFETRKAMEIGNILGIVDSNDQQLRGVIGHVIENVISTLKAADTSKKRETLSPLGMSKSLAAAVIGTLLPPAEHADEQAKEERARLENAVVIVIHSIVDAVEVCLNPPKPRPEKSRTFGQGRARKPTQR